MNLASILSRNSGGNDGRAFWLPPGLFASHIVQILARIPNMSMTTFGEVSENCFIATLCDRHGGGRLFLGGPKKSPPLRGRESPKFREGLCPLFTS